VIRWGSAGLVLLSGVVVSIAIAQGGGNDVERSSYLRENAGLLAQVPTFPGASRLLVIDVPWRMRQDPYGGSYIAGYVTRALCRASPVARV
jgi:hypothetical protein